MPPIPSLIHLLTYCRPHRSATEEHFVGRYLQTLPGAWSDPHGNVHVTVGTPDILWSCHTDTVHRTDGRQQVSQIYDRIVLTPGSTSACLGGDDTVGVYLCLSMIAAGRSGHYIFHRGEECGGVGSRALAASTPHLLAGSRYAIALDRAGTGDIVTSQCGRRCCSDVFAESLAQALAPTFRHTDRYHPAAGTYTDTHEYRHLIPECTNLSVGYTRAHSPTEVVDTRHVARLLHALCVLDPAHLQCVRSTSEPDKSLNTFPTRRWFQKWGFRSHLESDLGDPGDRRSLLYSRERGERHSRDDFFGDRRESLNTGTRESAPKSTRRRRREQRLARLSRTQWDAIRDYVITSPVEEHHHDD